MEHLPSTRNEHGTPKNFLRPAMVSMFNGSSGSANRRPMAFAINLASLMGTVASMWQQWLQPDPQAELDAKMRERSPAMWRSRMSLEPTGIAGVCACRNCDCKVVRSGPNRALAASTFLAAAAWATGKWSTNSRGRLAGAEASSDSENIGRSIRTWGKFQRQCWPQPLCTMASKRTETCQRGFAYPANCDCDACHRESTTWSPCC